MKVVAISPTTSSLQIVLVEGPGDNFSIQARDEWVLASDDRPSEYVEIRKRLVERVSAWSPDAVCVAPLEPAALRSGHAASMAWFKTAELRGVAAEAARSVCVNTHFRYATQVSKTVGKRKAAEYVADDNEWSKYNIPKKYRDTVIIAVSYLRQHDQP